MGKRERNPGGLLGFAEQISSTKVPWLHETVGRSARSWNLRVSASEMERKGALKRSLHAEAVFWTPGSAGRLGFTGFSLSSNCSLWHARAVMLLEPACQFGPAEIFHAEGKSAKCFIWTPLSLKARLAKAVMKRASYKKAKKRHLLWAAAEIYWQTPA